MDAHDILNNPFPIKEPHHFTLEERHELRRMAYCHLARSQTHTGNRPPTHAAQLQTKANDLEKRLFLS